MMGSLEMSTAQGGGSAPYGTLEEGVFSTRHHGSSDVTEK